MSDANVIDFPRRATAVTPQNSYRDWLAWVECELSILGYDLSACDYDWRAAHARGLRPEAAAAEAARRHESV